MKKNLKNLFSEDVQKILTDETLTAIEEAIEVKQTLAVESALATQDDEYAEKLKTLIKSIDADHTDKTKRIMEAYDKDKSVKLVNLVKKYEREQGSDLHKFKKSIVESVGAFIDEFINESISKEDLTQAVNNKAAYNVLKNLRGVLAIDSVVMKESVSAGLKDAKDKIDSLVAENAKVKNNFKILKEQKENSDRKLFLEQKTSKFSEDKKKFVSKALGDKSAEFIKENFDYTMRLFDKQEKKQIRVIKEEAIERRSVKPDFVKNEKVLAEKVNNIKDAYDPYVAEMEKMKF